LVAESWHNHLDHSTDDSDTAIATDEECPTDWNEEMDEIAQMGIKVAIEQMERGQFIPMEESISRINKKLGLS